MNWDVDSCLSLVFVEDVEDLLNRLIVASVCAFKNNEDSDSVLVNVLLDQLRIKCVIAGLGNRQDSSLGVKSRERNLLCFNKESGKELEVFFCLPSPYDAAGL